MAKITKWFVRFFLWIFILFLALFFTFSVALLFPKVQYLVVNRLLNEIRAKTDHRIELDQVRFGWFDYVELGGLRIYDLQDSLMISIGHLGINFDVAQLYNTRSLILDQMVVNNSDVHFIKHNDSTFMNIAHFVNTLKGDQARGSFRIKQIVLNETRFRMDDNRIAKRIDKRLDFSHLSFELNEISIRRFDVRPDTIRCQINSIRGEEVKSDLRILAFESSFHLNPHAIILGALEVQTEHSTIRDSIRFDFTEMNDWSDFKNKVRLYANLEIAEVGFRDIAIFTGQVNEQLDLIARGILAGTFNDLTLKNANVVVASGSMFRGTYTVKNAGEADMTFDLNMENSRILQRDIRFFANDTYSLGDLRYKGRLSGSLNNLVVIGYLFDRRGSLGIDGRIKNLMHLPTLNFESQLSFNSYLLADFMPQNTHLKLNGNGIINGSGIQWEDGLFEGEVKLTNAEIDRFTLASTNLNFKLQEGILQWSGDIADPKINIKGGGNFLRHQDEMSLLVNFDIRCADLSEFGLTPIPVAIGGVIDAGVTGTSVDDLEGYIELQKFGVKLEGFNELFESIRASARLDGDLHYYDFEGPGIDIQLKGDFLFSQLLTDVPEAAQSYWEHFTRRSSPGDSLGQDEEVKGYNADLAISGEDLSLYVSLFGLPYRISEDAHLEASFAKRGDTYFTMFAEADTVSFDNRIFTKNMIDVNASKDMRSNSVLALLYVESGVQDWDVITPTRNLKVESVWNNEKIDAEFRIQQPENENSAVIRSQFSLLRDTVQFRLLNSELYAFGSQWKINEDNLISWYNSRMLVESMELFNSEQSIAINGVYSPTNYSLLEMEVKNFELKNLSVLLPRDFSGIMNSKGIFSKMSPDDPVNYSSRIKIRNLEFERFTVGDISGRTRWDGQSQGLALEFEIQRNLVDRAVMTGTIKPFEEVNQLDATLRIQDMQINWLEPFFSTSISRLGGITTGDMSFSGLLFDPQVKGNANIKNGAMTINYLNTTYNFNGDIQFDQNSINLMNFALEDRLGNAAYLQGKVTHKQLKGDSVVVAIDFKNFEVLNTSKLQNNVYHGTVYGTGDMTIVGPFDNISFTLNATTNSNTRLYVPLESQTYVQQSDYITFYNPSDTSTNPAGQEQVEIARQINLDFSIDLTPDAYVELIFDPVTGDIIRGRANGDLRMSMVGNGDFELFGNVEINEGAYNWTTSLLNKEFKVVPGGTITFYGDPYQGVLDLDATYRQIADLSDLDPETYVTASKNPVLVVLGLNGAMTRPNITFRIDLDESNTTSSEISWREEIARINANQAELKRQVFSLLLLRKFSTYNSFVVGVGEGLGNSVSEFMSNQLSYWINQMDENLEVSIDLTGLDQAAFETFQVRLAYTFMDGRLRVSGAGGNSPTDLETGGAYNFLGDWSVDYILTKDGRLRVKVFSQTNQYDIDQQNSFEAGVSLRYVRSFDEFKNILESARKKALIEAEESSKADARQEPVSNNE